MDTVEKYSNLPWLVKVGNSSPKILEPAALNKGAYFGS